MTYPAGSFFTGWTHIVNTPNGVLFYRSSDGASWLGGFDINGNFYTVNANPASFSAGWTQVVNTPNGVFFYKASDGSGAFGEFDIDGVYEQTER